MSKINLYKVNIFVFILLYISLILGFVFNENLNYGSYIDWVGAYVNPIKDFSDNFTHTILNYDQYGNRHSPAYLIILSSILKIGFSIDFVRLIHLHFCLFLILIFYKCLKLQFRNTEKKTLQLVSLVIFLSPTFRSLAIWPDSRIIGLILFVLTIYFFIKFMRKNNMKFAFYCAFALILSSYISPNFSVFFIFFYYFFFKKLRFLHFSYLIIISAILSFPMLFYLFILDINFLIAGKTPGTEHNFNLDFNLSNKILIITSIFLFHILPIIFNLIDRIHFYRYLKKNLILLLLLFLVCIYFFNYEVNFTGGGVFFQASNFIFGNNYLFFLICFFSLVITGYISNLNYFNFLLIALTILSNLQNSIYHKYYEPFFLIITLILFKNLKFENFFRSKKSILFLYSYNLIFALFRVFKNKYLV